MSSKHAWPAFVATCLVVGSSLFLRAADWTTTDGKVYEDVKLIRLDRDAVTILYADGGARIPLAHLPADLQKRFGYDPAAAKAAADARAKEDAENARALQAEMDEASAQRQAGPEPPEGAAPKSDPAATNISILPTPVYSTGTHHFIEETTTPASSTTASPAASTHHSMDEMMQSATAMRRDLSDPAYHTMAHLNYTVNADGLGPDTSDPNHHTIDQATGGSQ